MKFLYLYCSHFKGTNPLRRRGNYFEDMEAKLVEILSLAKELKVDRVLHGGDFCDAPMMSLGLVDVLVDLIEDAGIEWYITRGNHDEIGHNPNLSGESILDHIYRRSKIIRHMGARTAGNVYIEGFDYYHGIENDIREKHLMSSMPHLNCKKIAVVHAFITPEKWLPQVLHIPVSDISTDFNLVLIAHNHSEFGIIRKKSFGGESATFVSIGSLARLTIAKHDVERTPNVLFVDTEEPKMQIIPLKCARPSQEIFDFSEIQEGRDFESSIENFISSLEGVKFQGVNLKGIVEGLGQSQGYDRRVIDEVVNRIARMEESR